MIDRQGFWEICKRTVPVFFGYIPLGTAFGLMFAAAGFPWYQAILMSIFVYAGAAQFLAVELLSGHVGLVSVGIITFMINFRHLFYGLPFIEKFANIGNTRYYLMFAMTDETYGLLTALEKPDNISDKAYYLTLEALNHSYWVAGTAIGVFLGNFISFSLMGIDYVLTALFIVLVIEQWKNHQNKILFLFGAVGGILGLLLFGKSNMLLAGSLIGIGLLIIFRKTVKHHG